MHVRVLVGDDDLALDLAALQGAELEIGGILLAGLDVADELALAGLGDVAGDFGGDVVDGGFPLVDKGDLDARVVPDIEFGGDLDGVEGEAVELGDGDADLLLGGQLLARLVDDRLIGKVSLIA
ncbi:MAG: hypothetical protein ACLVL7_10220 [Anaerotruncus massiliensis (ex Togo et al. 2019)]